MSKTVIRVLCSTAGASVGYGFMVTSDTVDKPVLVRLGGRANSLGSAPLVQCGVWCATSVFVALAASGCSALRLLCGCGMVTSVSTYLWMRRRSPQDFPTTTPTSALPSTPFPSSAVPSRLAHHTHPLRPYAWMFVTLVLCATMLDPLFDTAHARSSLVRTCAHTCAHAPVPAILQLGAVIVVAFLANAMLATTQFKLAALMAATSVSSVILCQYKGCCGHTGTTQYFLERMVGLGLGFKVLGFCWSKPGSSPCSHRVGGCAWTV